MTFLCINKNFVKKRIGWLVGLLVVLLVVGFVGSYYTVKKEPATVQPTQEKVKGVWLNYMEVASLMNGVDEQEYKSNLDTVLNHLQDMGFNTLFFHVRSHSDSLYPSRVFPWSKFVNQGQGVTYDPLKIAIEKAREKKIAIHAWINPYRISSGTLEELSAGHPAVALKEKEATAVVETASGVYYNPDCASVRELVLQGVKEILENYTVDGIQYDDYFYPTTEASFDQESYARYCEDREYPLSLAEYRCTQVNLLISATHRLVHEYKGVVFGVSPAAGIKKNKDTLYADVAAWVQGEYVDYLCPQLYFGFEYPVNDFRFDEMYLQWQTLVGDLPLYVGIASYKVGQVDNGSYEWVTSTDLLAKQVQFSKQAQGICVYHYSSLRKEDEQSIKQRQELQNALAEF